MSDGAITLTREPLRGMITVRGDFEDRTLQKAATSTGLDFPAMGKATSDGPQVLAWMSPDELLLMIPHDEAQKQIVAMTDTLGQTHSLVADVSDARAIFRLSGAGVRDVIAKLSPMDIRPQSFQPGDFRRTRLAQIAAAIRMVDAQTIEIICFRSVADYAESLLARAVMPDTEVGHLA